MCPLPVQPANTLGPSGKGQTEAVQHSSSAGVLQDDKSRVPSERLRRAKCQEKLLQPLSFTRRELVRTAREEAKENRVIPKDLYDGCQEKGRQEPPHLRGGEVVLRYNGCHQIPVKLFIR